MKQFSVENDSLIEMLVAKTVDFLVLFFLRYEMFLICIWLPGRGSMCGLWSMRNINSILFIRHCIHVSLLSVGNCLRDMFK